MKIQITTKSTDDRFHPPPARPDVKRNMYLYETHLKLFTSIWKLDCCCMLSILYASGAIDCSLQPFQRRHYGTCGCFYVEQDSPVSCSSSPRRSERNPSRGLVGPSTKQPYWFTPLLHQGSMVWKSTHIHTHTHTHTETTPSCVCSSRKVRLRRALCPWFGCFQ